MRKLVWFVAAAVLALAAAAYAQGYGGYDYSTPTGASALAEALKTAQSHATFAAQAESMAGVRQHLAHVVNCLQGPRGSDYNARDGNPCEGQGNGIIPDLTARGAQGAKALAKAREANTAALAALKVTALAQAKVGATNVANLLSAAMKELPQ
ncbi:MAG: hypothetical protein ACRDFT_01830 [bacterium]